MHRPVLSVSTAILIVCGVSAASAQTAPSQETPAPATTGARPSEQPKDTAVLVDGKLNVPGAPADSQTVPAKFSERNDRLDKLPTMALPLGLNDEQRRAIVDSVKQANAPVQSTAAKPADSLPVDIAMHELGASANIPSVGRLKYVRTADRILLVEPSNRIVVGEIASQ